MERRPIHTIRRERVRRTLESGGHPIHRGEQRWYTLAQTVDNLSCIKDHKKVERLWGTGMLPVRTRRVTRSDGGYSTREVKIEVTDRRHIMAILERRADRYFHVRTGAMPPLPMRLAIPLQEPEE